MVKVKTKRERLGAYWTPPQMLQALAKHELDASWGKVWEPACGSGNIVKYLRRLKIPVTYSDVEDHGFKGTKIHDFHGLFFGDYEPDFTSIITNPPFFSVHLWVKNCFLYNSTNIALLMPSSALGDVVKFLPKYDYSLTKIINFEKPMPFDGPDGLFNLNWGASWFVMKKGKGQPGVIINHSDSY